jgi:hypothetical protein
VGIDIDGGGRGEYRGLGAGRRMWAGDEGSIGACERAVVAPVAAEHAWMELSGRRSA